jgi:hypothetical protein
MKNNLTQTQQAIIDSVIAEFDKINEVKKSNTKGLLFDVKIIYDQIEKENKITEEININNIYMNKLLDDMIQKDCERLNESLNEVNIEAIQIVNRIKIKKIGKESCEDFHITYNRESCYVSVGINKSIRKMGVVKNLSCYLTNHHRENYYHSIEELCNESYFANKIQILMNK